MKVLRVFIYFLFVVLVAYVSAYIGYLNGFTFTQSANDIEAYSDVRVLKLLRENKSQEAIEEMEGRLNLHIASYMPENKIFGAMYPWLGISNPRSPSKFFALVKKYREETNYQCNQPEDVCVYIKEQLEKY